MRAGEKAFKRLVEGHLWLVVAIADDYLDRGLPRVALIEAGNLGLVRPVQRFDPRRDTGLAGPAAAAIRRAITEALDGRS